jgi:1A family penicillin-binding protein
MLVVAGTCRSFVRSRPAFVLLLPNPVGYGMRTRRAVVVVAWVLVIGLGALTGLAVERLWTLRASIEELAHQLQLEIGPESTLIYDGNDELLAAVYEEHRIPVALESVSPNVIHAVLITEDRRFYEHDGVDVWRILGAAVENHRAGAIVQGGSTITQQLVRSVVLSRERTYERKFTEAVLARRMEERYTKHDILQAYLNRVYFGDGYYGIEAASLGYFGKTSADVTVGEAALLAGLIKGPSIFSPTRAPERARARRDLVLELMREEGLLSEQEFQAAVSVEMDELIVSQDAERRPDPRRTRGAEYFRDLVVRELRQRFGSETLYTGGLRVYTTVDRHMQSLAEAAVSARLESLQKRVQRRRSGDESAEPLQGALVALNPRTGEVKAIVGGRDFSESPFNRAFDARRQPGSTFKPFIFAMALESGLSPSTRIDGLDEPIASLQGPWLPGGDSEEVTSVRLRDALVRSSNRAAAHLLQQVGVRRTLELVERFGIRSPMPEVPSVALGTGEVSLFELTAAYAVFANHGVSRPPTLIRRVVDRDGREIYRSTETGHAVISESTAYLMNTMMADVIDRGTANSARRAGFKGRAAGKTGTSNDYADSWFVGYTPQLVAGVWFGYDTPRMIMDRGFAGVVAVPAWAQFMTAATKDTDDEWFKAPGSVASVRLCRLSGLRATSRCHLPVMDEHPHDQLADSTPTAREGGVYEELRSVGRQPRPCTLPHSRAALDHIASALFLQPEPPLS